MGIAPLQGLGMEIGWPPLTQAVEAVKKSLGKR